MYFSTLIYRALEVPVGKLKLGVREIHSLCLVYLCAQICNTVDVYSICSMFSVWTKK